MYKEEPNVRDMRIQDLRVRDIGGLFRPKYYEWEKRHRVCSFIFRGTVIVSLLFFIAVMRSIRTGRS